MHPPSPVTPFTPSVSPEFRSPKFSGPPPPTPRVMSASSTYSMETDPDEPKLFDKRAGNLYENRARSRPVEDMGSLSPDLKRRRMSHSTLKPTLQLHRDKSPESSHTPHTPITARTDVYPRNMMSFVLAGRPNQAPQGKPHPDPNLKLPPLQTMAPVTPLTPISQSQQLDSSVEATVMTIPFLNKIKVLAKISPPLTPSFHTTPQTRGPVIAIEGQDPHLVQIAVEYLDKLLKKESKYDVRTFEGPELRAPRDTIPESGTSDTTAEYLTKISKWHSVSERIVNFVKVASSTASSVDSRSSPEADVKSVASLSPKSLVPQTANLHIQSPAHSSENGSEASVLCSQSHSALIPVALVPRYQLTTADAFACSTPIHDSYKPLDHWQWMASLWRTCVGPDITVYIRECSREELANVGGNPVEIRLQDARTIILRKVGGSGRDLEEKALKRVGFEIEDFLTQ